MRRKRAPAISLVAGPNGSGKTSFAESYFLARGKRIAFINPDIIAAGLSPTDVGGAAFQAGRVMLARVRELIASKESFAFESTLSGKTWLPLLRRATQVGYKVTIYFLTLSEPELCLGRIRNRVSEGGHNIPREAVLRRFPRSHQNFWTLYRPLCSAWHVFDNSRRRPKLLVSHSTYSKLTPEKRDALEAHFLEGTSPA